ncbi:MAG TPA: PQQ-binding-like beta-propeller repeat protein [Verrucomicrobiae bacterium]|nr:PQQ-binding-like beta-propeller repeat protein [Verrucomicrobiae bacterium]
MPDSGNQNQFCLRFHFAGLELTVQKTALYLLTSWLNRISVFALILLASEFLFPAAAAGQGGRDPHRSWMQYGGNADQSKFVDFAEITKSNVSQLQVAWHYAGGDGAYMFNPIVVDGIMYVLGQRESLVALDATSGREIWVRPNLSGIIRTGINYWESKDRKDRRLLFCRQNRLEAINACTGEPIRSFGVNGSVSLKEGLGRDPESIRRVQSTTPGQIFENLILLGSSPGENYFSAPGHLRAYDVVSGKLVWVFHTIPWPGEFGYENWLPEAYKYVGGVNAWGEITIDEKNGIAFFPLGAPTYDYYGADRKGSSLFANCILALDARTGKRLWHFQAVHHDLWDYDFCSAPQLITVEHERKKVEAVAIAGKQGFLYVFDRFNGTPLWPIEERPVPASDVVEEQAWPTQPFPTAIPPFTRQTVTTNDINPFFSREKREEWIKRIAAAKTGLYQPLSDKQETIAMPGAVGGANRGNSAADPDKGIVYIIAQDFASVYRLKPEEPLASATVIAGPTNSRLPKVVSEVQANSAQTIYQQNCQACHGADMAGRAAIPALRGIGKRLSLSEFSTTVSVGKGVMPGFPHVDEKSMENLFTYLGGRIDKNLSASEGQKNRGELRNYPAGIHGPAHNFSSGYGMEFPDLLSPPWSWVIAYDLNRGVIKWRRPLGHDPKLPKIDGKELGIPVGSQRKGMIVTATGLLFSTCLDGKIYAYDTDDGALLWSSQLPRNPEGLPAMYTVNGRQFLVVCDMGKVIDSDAAKSIPSGYIVYALPENKQHTEVTPKN